MTMYNASILWAKDEDAPKFSLYRIFTTQTSFPLSPTSFTPNKNGEQIAIADNQVAKIE